MESRRQQSRTDDTRRVTTSRRALLAASGAAAVGALSGCLSRVASSVTKTGSSPAAVLAGTDWNDDDTEVTFTFEDERRWKPHVARLTPSISAGSGLLSRDVELEGWVTATALVAANYNNSRSTKSTIRAPGGDADADADGVVDDDVRGEDYNSPRSNRSIAGPSDIVDDDIDEDDETFRRVSRLDAQLEEATTAAATAISKRSARTGRNPETEKEITEALGDMEAVLAEMRAVLERCSDESCVAALANVADRESDVRRAQEYAQDGEWAAFGLGGGGGNDIIVGDYLLPPVGFDPSGSFSADERAELFRYLETNPVVAERFSVCLPDAEVPGGNESIRGEVTPERLIEYLTGESDADGRVYSWGRSQAGPGDPNETGDCDDDDPRGSPGAVCGTTPHFVSEVSGPVATGGSLEVIRAEDGTVVVVNSPPEADGGQAAVRVSADGRSDGPESRTDAIYQSWSGGASNGDGKATPEMRERRASNGNGKASPYMYERLVTQVLVQPPRCPVPVPALFYVGRATSDGQLLYSGGLVIDDAALYESSTTVLTLAGAARVVGIECCLDFTVVNDSDDDGLVDVLARAGLSEREQRGARIDSGTVSALVASGTLSEDGGGGVVCWGENNHSRTNPDSCGEAGGASGESLVTHCPLDAPVLHLANAGSASADVKFKAGAELSKSVN